MKTRKRSSELFWPLATTKTLNWPNGRLPNSLKICCFMSWDSLYPGNFALRVWKKRGKYSQVLAWVDGTTFLNDLIKWVENFWASFQWTKSVHKWSKRFQTASHVKKCQIILKYMSEDGLLTPNEAFFHRNPNSLAD